MEPYGTDTRASKYCGQLVCTVLQSLCSHRYGTDTGQIRDRYGADTGQIRDRYGTDTGQIRDRYGTDTGQIRDIRDRYGTDTGQIRDRYGTDTGQIRDRYGTDTGQIRDSSRRDTNTQTNKHTNTALKLCGPWLAPDVTEVKSSA